MNPNERTATGTTGNGQSAWADLTKDQILDRIKTSMDVLKAADDPLKSFFKRMGINVDTHDVYLNNCHKSVLTDPPAYVKFSTAVDAKGYLAVERIDNNLLTPAHERMEPWWLNLKVT